MRADSSRSLSLSQNGSTSGPRRRGRPTPGLACHGAYRSVYGSSLRAHASTSAGKSPDLILKPLTYLRCNSYRRFLLLGKRKARNVSLHGRSTELSVSATLRLSGPSTNLRTVGIILSPVRRLPTHMLQSSGCRTNLCPGFPNLLSRSSDIVLAGARLRGYGCEVPFRVSRPTPLSMTR